MRVREFVKPQVDDTYINVRTGAEPCDARVRSRCHRGDPRIVRVEHGRSVIRECRDQLSLGDSDRVARSELAEMRSAHVEHDGDPRRRDRGQIGNVSWSTRAVFAHECSGLLRHLEHGQRQTDLVVERVLRCDDGALQLQHVREEILRRRLAIRTSDTNDGATGRAPKYARRELAERARWIGHDDGGRADVVLREGRNGAGLDRRTREVVTVDVLTPQAHEQRSRRRLPRVDDDRPRHLGRRVGAAGKRAVRQLRDLGQVDADHGTLA